MSFINLTNVSNKPRTLAEAIHPFTTGYIEPWRVPEAQRQELEATMNNIRAIQNGGILSLLAIKRS
ncbi:hypothetical protein [Phyllobacterium sp. 22552]|uniref:hypothetical protein n=1 Tax=Phyllobacterium sp. 22552 TaxID=3453941 RepID=UPI003F85190F